MRELGRGIVMISRSPLNQIVIDHSTVAAQHAVLLKTGASYSLKDLNSTTGTQINDILVTDTELKDGDTIRFDSVISCLYRNKNLAQNGLRRLDNVLDWAGVGIGVSRWGRFCY